MCALVTGVQTCALPIFVAILLLRPDPRQREAKAARVVAPAADRCEFGIIFVRQLGPLHRARPRELEPRRLVERPHRADVDRGARSEEHTSELQSLMRISYAVFCLKKKKKLSTY